MSRTNHDRSAVEQRAHEDAQKYRRAKEKRDRNRELRESLRELNRAVDYWGIELPLALATVD